MSTPQKDALQIARERMAALSNQLVDKFGVEAAVGLLNGCGLVLLRAHLSKQSAISYYLTLAADLENDPDSPSNSAEGLPS